MPALASVAEDKVLPVERPMFILSKTLKMFYNLESDESRIPGKKMGPFSCTGLAFGASTSKDSTNVQSAGYGHRGGSTNVVAQHPAPP